MTLYMAKLLWCVKCTGSTLTVVPMVAVEVEGMKITRATSTNKARDKATIEAMATTTNQHLDAMTHHCFYFAPFFLPFLCGRQPVEQSCNKLSVGVGWLAGTDAAT